jgi:hypothetical protein
MASGRQLWDILVEFYLQHEAVQILRRFDFFKLTLRQFLVSDRVWLNSDAPDLLHVLEWDHHQRVAFGVQIAVKFYTLSAHNHSSGHEIVLKTTCVFVNLVVPLGDRFEIKLIHCIVD